MKRKYFGTDGIRGRVGDSQLTPEFVLKLGWAAGKVLGHYGEGHVLIGKDTRISGYMFESALEAGLSAAGVDIHLLGPMPTPAIAYLTRTLRASAGIVISASHNPYYDNGIKFLSSTGSKLPDDVEYAIEEALDQPLQCVDSAELGKADRIVDAAGRYIEFCKSTFPTYAELKGLKIVVDCAHGATYQIAPKVFKELGAEVIVIGSKPNGMNINEKCGATDPKSLQQQVKEEQAHLGIALDGDGDRLIMVDHRGEVVDGDEILYVIACNRVAKKTMTGGIVGTVMSNLGLELALKELNIPFMRAKVGDRYVMQLLQQENWLLGGETSGHVICLDKTCSGDGIVSALQVLACICESGKPLHELKQAMLKFPQIMVNIPLKKGGNPCESAIVKQAVLDAERELNKRGRVLLRPSGTEPLVRVMVEGADLEQVRKTAQFLADVVANVVS